MYEMALCKLSRALSPLGEPLPSSTTLNYWLISLSVALLFVYTLWHLTAWTLYFVAHRSRNTSLMLRLLTIAPRRIARKAAIALALPAFALSSPATAASIDLSWGGEIPSTSTSQLADGAHTDQSVVAPLRPRLICHIYSPRQKHHATSHHNQTCHPLRTPTTQQKLHSYACGTHQTSRQCHRDELLRERRG